MKNEARIEFISAGFKEILAGEGVRNVVTQAAQETAQRAGEGFAVDVIYGGYGGGRWIGFVGSTDRESAAAESEYKVLSSAVR